MRTGTLMLLPLLLPFAAGAREGEPGNAPGGKPAFSEAAGALAGATDRSKLEEERTRIETVKAAVVAALPTESPSSGDWTLVLEASTGDDLLAQAMIRGILAAEEADPAKLDAFFDKIARTRERRPPGPGEKAWIGRRAMLVHAATFISHFEREAPLAERDFRMLARDPLAWRASLEAASSGGSPPWPSGNRTTRPAAEGEPALPGGGGASGILRSGGATTARHERAPGKLPVIAGIAIAIGILLAWFGVRLARSRGNRAGQVSQIHNPSKKIR